MPPLSAPLTNRLAFYRRAPLARYRQAPRSGPLSRSHPWHPHLPLGRAGVSGHLGHPWDSLRGRWLGILATIPCRQSGFADFWHPRSILGLYYGFYLRRYALGEALSESFFSFLGSLGTSLLVAAIVTTLFWLPSRLLKKTPWGAKPLYLWIDISISRLIEIMISLPTTLLIFTIAAIAKPSLFLVMAVIGLTSWTGIARFMRGEMLKVRQVGFHSGGTGAGVFLTYVSFSCMHCRMLLRRCFGIYRLCRIASAILVRVGLELFRDWRAAGDGDLGVPISLGP